MTSNPHLIPLLFFMNQTHHHCPIYSLDEAIPSSIHVNIEDELQRVLLVLASIGLVQLQQVFIFSLHNNFISLTGLHVAVFSLV